MDPMAAREAPFCSGLRDVSLKRDDSFDARFLQHLPFARRLEHSWMLHSRMAPLGYLGEIRTGFYISREVLCGF